MHTQLIVITTMPETQTLDNSKGAITIVVAQRSFDKAEMA